jgi:hypothetical protein
MREEAQLSKENGYKAQMRLINNEVELKEKTINNEQEN